MVLFVSLGVLFYFSQQILHQEAKIDAEQTLENTTQNVDNILLSVEQSTSNVYNELTRHLDQPERMATYARRLVECNPYVNGCAVCFKPDYYPGRKLFMAYVHRKDASKRKNGEQELVTSDKYGSKPYTEHLWYSVPMASGKACWTDPLPEEEDEGVTLSYCMPIYDRTHECIGVLVADLSVSLLSQLVLAAKSSDSEYSVLLGSDGSFIVHPDLLKRMNATGKKQVLNSGNSSMKNVVDSMRSGKAGYMPFRHADKDWLVFYKPFLQTETPARSMEKTNWSIGVVYSENDMFGSFYRLLLWAITIAVVGLLLFYLLSRIITRRVMKPIRQLTHATQRIAEGHYDEPMPEIKRDDEIGLLYDRFLLMKQSLAARVGELDQLTGALKMRREVMREVYAKEQSVDRVMNSFLHYVTNQMIAPSEDIGHCIKTLSGSFHEFSPEEVHLVLDTLDKKSNTIVELINNMLNTADNEAGKEAHYE